MGKSKKKAKKEEIFTKSRLMKSIMGIFTSDHTQSLNYKQISKRLEIKDPSTKRLVNEALNQLARQELIREVNRGRFMSNVVSKTLEGVVEMEMDGNAYVVTDDHFEFFVSEHNLNHALNGDRVRIAIAPSRRRKRMEALVLEVTDRAKRTFVGIIEMGPNYAFVNPDSRLMRYDIFIPKEGLNHAKQGQKVIVRITDWPMHTKSPMGEVVEVIGNPGVHEVEMHAILAEFELPYRFPEQLNRVAMRIPDRITKKDYEQRRDFRGVPTFTIDPEDAKDFDDALSFRVINEAMVEVGIHIADVTHYVLPGSPIDTEAAERGTSVYLVDRCVPMLPERLSNFICSLRPNEEKLCFSAVFEMDTEGNVHNQWFGRTVILSQRKFSYDEAQRAIETGEGEMATEIVALNGMAQKLRQRRLKAGAISFDRVEVKFQLDETFKPVGVFFREQKEAHQLIEEFMLLANRKVAEHIGKARDKQHPKPFVYRIHDKPNPEKFESFRAFITRFGYNIQGGTPKQLSKSLNLVLGQIKGKKEQNLIETLALRAMAKARYSTHNIGHYGLSFAQYTHFTSPIRRYPDMMAHRLLAHYLSNGKPQNQEELEKTCNHSTEMEIRATDAERASIKYKQVEFMADKIGQHFQGVITGVTSFGIFVELTQSKCEGLIPVRELQDDFYEFDEENYCLTGRQGGRKFQLGDEITVEVWRANLAKKQLDFLLAGENGSNATGETPNAKGKKGNKPGRKR